MSIWLLLLIIVLVVLALGDGYAGASVRGRAGRLGGTPVGVAAPARGSPAARSDGSRRRRRNARPVRVGRRDRERVARPVGRGPTTVIGLPVPLPLCPPGDAVAV